MQLDLPFLQAEPPPSRVEFVRVRRARRYILRVRPDGTVRVTILRRGSCAKAAAFIGKQLALVERERARIQREQAPLRWAHGSTILLSAEPSTITVERAPRGFAARVGGRGVAVEDPYTCAPRSKRISGSSRASV